MRAPLLALVCLFAIATGAACAAPAASFQVPQSARSRAAEARVVKALTLDLERQGLQLGAPVYLRITKQPALAQLFLADATGAYVLFRAYPICAFSGALGPKLRQGDGQAPEGVYAVRPAAMNPVSSYHLSFNLGYPNAYDRAHGRTGDYLMVNGDCVSIGCYAMTDPAIEEIWALFAAAMREGQASVPVHIFPFPMTAANLATHANDPNAAFWRDLAPVWAAFEQTKSPPRIVVRGGRYAVAP